MIIDYALVQELLDRTAPDISPALLHGVISGFLCSGGDFDASILPDLLQLPVPALVGELADGLSRETLSSLGSDEFAFQPLLPDDENALGERLLALSHWCDWFVTGFAAGFMRPQSELGAEMAEVLDDLAQLAAADPFEGEADEQDEGDYMELVEYVRMASISLFRHCVESTIQH